MVGRFVVRDCSSGRLAEGATVEVRTDNDDATLVASGITTDTGTVALGLPDRSSGRPFVARITRPVATAGADPNDPPVESVDEVVKRFTAKCGITEIEAGFGETWQVCIRVIDIETNTPVAGIPVSLFRQRGTMTVPVGEEVSDVDGMACFEGGADDYVVYVNGGQLGLLPTSHPIDPDYIGNGGPIKVPDCGNFTETFRVRLVENRPGCFPAVILGCGCGLPGVDVTVRGVVRRGVGPSGVNTPSSIDPWSVTKATDGSGRVWFCAPEDVPTFDGLYYDADADRWDQYIRHGIDLDPPAPYLPVENAWDTSNAWGFQYHLQTPAAYWCFSGCTGLIPETLNVQFSGVLGGATVTLAKTHPTSTQWSGCLTIGTTRFTIVANLGRTSSDCDPPGYESASVSIHYRYWPCETDPPQNSGPVSEHWMDLYGVSGTVACPTSVTVQEGSNVLVSGRWVWTWGSATATITRGS